MPTPADQRASGEEVTAPPKRNRAIIGLGLALCVIGAIAVAYLLGALDRIGLLP